MTEKGKTVSQFSDDKSIVELAFLVDITTYLNELEVKLKENVNYCLTCFLMFEASEMKLLHKHINEQNLDHFPFCKIALESFIKPFDWLMLKNKFVSIIQQLRN
jgi:hypothetical protein